MKLTKELDIDELLHKEKQGTLTRNEKKSLYNWRYRNSEEGKERKKLSRIEHNKKYKSFNVSILKEDISRIERLIGENLNGRSISRYLTIQMLLSEDDDE
jgi:hypothetical protein